MAGVWSGAQVCLVQPKLCARPSITKLPSLMEGSWAHIALKGILGNTKSFGFKRRKRSFVQSPTHLSHTYGSKQLETTQSPSVGNG